MFAGWTVAEVEGELFDHCFGVGSGFDLDDNRQHVAFGERLVGDERVAVLGEAHACGLRAAAAGDGDDMFAEGNGFARVIDSGDLHFTVLCEEELEVGFDGGDDTPAVRAGDFLGVVAVVVAFVGAFLVLLVFCVVV